MPRPALAPRSAACRTVGRTTRVSTPAIRPSSPSNATDAASADGHRRRRAQSTRGHSTEENRSASSTGNTITQILPTSHSPAATATPMINSRADHPAAARTPDAITAARSIRGVWGGDGRASITSSGLWAPPGPVLTRESSLGPLTALD